MEDTSDAANMTCHGMDNERRPIQQVSQVYAQHDSMTNQALQWRTNAQQPAQRGKHSKVGQCVNIERR